MNLDNCQTFDRRGRELELAARPLLVLTCSHAQETITTKPKQKNHLHNFLYKTNPGTPLTPEHKAALEDIAKQLDAESKRIVPD